MNGWTREEEAACKVDGAGGATLVPSRLVSLGAGHRSAHQAGQGRAGLAAAPSSASHTVPHTWLAQSSCSLGRCWLRLDLDPDFG